MKQKRVRTLVILFFLFIVGIFFKSNAQSELPSCPSLDSFTVFPHLPPITQGFTGTCWSYAMVSFLESEHLRRYNDTIKLSEMWFAYCDFVGKIDQQIANRKDTFVEGSQCNAVLRYIKFDGALPAYAYLGRTKEAHFFDYSTLFESLQKLVLKIKKKKKIKGPSVKSKYVTLLNETMTEPPAVFYDTALNKELSPKEFAKSELKLDPYEYFSFMSNGMLPFGQRGVLSEPDNWWHGADFYNLPMDLFISALKEALVHGNTVVISGDVTEKTYQPHIPYSWFDNSAVANMDSLRVVEKLLKKTEDDHSWHIVGYYKSASGWWFYIKDSAFWDDPTNGYHFIHESYLRRKSVSMYMHKYAARSVMNDIIK